MMEELVAAFLESGKISTDTRNIPPGALFFALKGDRFDANEFADDALNKGAHLVVIDNPQFKKDDRYVVVPDVLTALQDLARRYRAIWKFPVIGLTGSNGKTTSKELVNAVLSCKFRTFATQGNLNNHIGVPLTILSVPLDCEIAIIEMGANHVGEIAFLSSIANPTHGFITNIGKAHIGTFGGFGNIIRGKTELYKHLLNTHGIVFINSQNPILAPWGKEFENPIYYHAPGDFYSCVSTHSDPFVVVRTEEGAEVETQLVGSYNVENIGVALCLGKYFGVDAAAANQAIRNYQPGNMRSQLIRKSSNTIILDAYNANPSSMSLAIQNLAELDIAHKAVILGDMFELEEESESEHRSIGQLLHQTTIEKIFLCGQLMRFAAEECPRAMYFPSTEQLMLELEHRPLNDFHILIKGSRGMKLEKVTDRIN